METVKFNELQLDEWIICTITEVGFEEASPIQTQTIPATMEGRDMVDQVWTKTGKTVTFDLPPFQEVDPKVKKLRAVVLLPTRELAIQVVEEMCCLAKFMHGVKVLPIYGGQDIVKQIRSLKDGTQATVGTPGRVMDHMRRKMIETDHVLTMVLDEADEMLSMGSLEDMEAILNQLPEERQTLMLSVIMSQTIAEIARKFQKGPVTARMIKEEPIVPKATQYYYGAKPKSKVGVMSRLLDTHTPKLPVMLCNTERQVDDLVQELQGRGYFAEGLCGDLKQVQCDRVMDSFRNERTDTLVATGVTARGMDIGDTETVFSYGIPQDDEYHAHCIDRTSRAGREGKTFSLVIGKEVYEFRDIRRYCEAKITPQATPSPNNATEIKVEKVLGQIQGVLNDMNLIKMVNIIEKKLMEEDRTSVDLAATLLKMSMGNESEDVIDSPEIACPLDELDSLGQGSSRGGDRERSSYGNCRKGAMNRVATDYMLGEGDEKMVRLFINVDEAQRIVPGDIPGAAAGESGIPGRMVGSIDMYDGCTSVDVPGRYTDGVLKAIAHAEVKGKNIRMEEANTNRR